MNGRGFTRVILSLSGLLGACAGDAPESASDDAAAQQVAETVSVQTEEGSIVGTRDLTATGQPGPAALYPVNKFLGIPYAKPPVGPLRWKRPERPEPWSEPRDATKFGKRCAQNESLVLQNAASADEDCLYLNVWTRAAQAGEPPQPPAPVLVFIHGGGNQNGSASEPVPYTDPAKANLFYSGHVLAGENAAVVVTLNYRLGVFGFFAHPGLTAEQSGGGNQGLYDQALALDWVKRNIAKFGGDPERVTIFGESAGSQDVCLQVASPKSRGLFHRAISQSGGCTTLNPTRATAEQSGQKLAAALGCDGADALACLRSQPVSKLLAPGVTPALSFGPIVDGDFIPDQPRTLYKKGEIAKVPYILGSNTDEGTLFVPAVVADEAALRAALTAQFGAASVEAILAQYPLASFDSPREALARIVGDARLVCTTTDTAALAQASGSHVWMYNFDIGATLPPGSTAPRLGATHGAELVYVFGTSALFTPESAKVSAEIRASWRNFAAFGNPGVRSASPAWPEWWPHADARLNLALTSSVVANFRATECAFWRARYEAAFAAAR
ncbi:MAG: carboxylesterase/lipase family protein [Polyangiales bacterium]